MVRVADRGFGVTPGQRFATGGGNDALRAAAEYADRHTLRVATISTPQTIYRDLHGNREKLDTSRDKTRRSTELMLPEARMLAAIGRKDLLA